MVDTLLGDKFGIKKIPPEYPTNIGFPLNPPTRNPLTPNDGNDVPPRKTPAGALPVSKTPEELEPLDVYSERRAA